MKVSDIKSSSLVDCSSKLEEVAVAQNEFMRIAIQEARDGISHGEGGPFGTAIVKDGILVASGPAMARWMPFAGHVRGSALLTSRDVNSIPLANHVTCVCVHVCGPISAGYIMVAR